MASQEKVLFKSCYFVLSNTVCHHDQLLWDKVKSIGFRMNYAEPYVVIQKTSSTASDIEELLRIVNKACHFDFVNDFQITEHKIEETNKIDEGSLTIKNQTASKQTQVEQFSELDEAQITSIAAEESSDTSEEYCRPQMNTRRDLQAESRAFDEECCKSKHERGQADEFDYTPHAPPGISSMANFEPEEEQTKAIDTERLKFDENPHALVEGHSKQLLTDDKLQTKNFKLQLDKKEMTNKQTKLVEMDIEIDCNPIHFATLLSCIALLPKKKNCSKVNVSLDKTSDCKISLNGKEEEVLLIKSEIDWLLKDEKIPSSVVRYERMQHLPAENVASVRGSSINRRTYGLDPEQEVQRSNLGAERGVGMDSFVVPPRKKLSEDLLTRNSGIKVKVLKTDITAQKVDAIVSAANSRLRHGGGISKAIADKAGSVLEQECSRFTKGEKKVGVTELFVSSGGKLPAKHVIHAVGPNWRAYKEERKEECARDLRRTVLNCLLEAAARGCRSIAIPSISSAIFGVPIPICTKAYLEAVQTFDIYNEAYLQSSLKEILFVDIVDEMVGHIQRQFRSEWEKEPPRRQVTDDFHYARKLFQQKDFKKSQPDERGHQPKQPSPVTQSVSNTQRSFSAPRPTPSSSEATSQKLVGYLYSVGGCNLCASTEPALRQRPDLIVLVGQLFKNLHWSPIVDFEREIKINTDFPSKENIFTILGGEKGFPLVVQFYIDKYDQENLDRVFYDMGNYWSIIRPCIKQVQSVVFTCAALYSGGFQAGRYPYLVDDKFVGAFTRNVYEFLMKSVLRNCNVTIAAGPEAMTKVYRVLESK